VTVLLVGVDCSLVEGGLTIVANLADEIGACGCRWALAGPLV